MSEQVPPTASPPAAPAPRGPRRALIAGAAVAAIAIIGLGAYLIPNHGASGAAKTTSDPTKTGCPSASAPPGWSAATTNVTDAQVGTTINAHVGDTVDFRLTAQKYTWDYVPPASRNAEALPPTGYYDSSLNDCIWRLKMTTTGQSVVTFDRRMLCPPHSSLICSDIVISWRYILNVQ